MKRHERRLENNLQSVLNFPRTPVAGGLTEGLLPIGCKGISDGISRVPRTASVGISTHASNCATRQLLINLVCTELCFVEQIEELHPELHTHPLRDLEVLVRREIGIR